MKHPKTVSHAGSAAGLIHRGSPQAFQMNRTYPAPAGSSVCECAINPTHCFRGVSQRSLNVPTTFVSNHTAPISVGTLLYQTLIAGGPLSCIPPVAGVAGIEFNSGDVQEQRQRIDGLVLFAIRADVNVVIIDAESVAAGSIDVSTLQSRMEDFAYMHLGLKAYYSADRADPWFDTTSLGYFRRPFGQFVLVPPLKWVDRDQAMEILQKPVNFRAGVPETPGFPFTVIGPDSEREYNVQGTINIECLFLPDPDLCPDVWPGELCPKHTIGNTRWYKGSLEAAKRD